MHADFACREKWQRRRPRRRRHGRRSRSRRQRCCGLRAVEVPSRGAAAEAAAFAAVFAAGRSGLRSRPKAAAKAAAPLGASRRRCQTRVMWSSRAALESRMRTRYMFARLSNFFPIYSDFPHLISNPPCRAVVGPAWRIPTCTHRTPLMLPNTALGRLDPLLSFVMGLSFDYLTIFGGFARTFFGN